MTAWIRYASRPIKPALSLLRSYMVAPLEIDHATQSRSLEKLTTELGGVSRDLGKLAGDVGDLSQQLATLQVAASRPADPQAAPSLQPPLVDMNMLLHRGRTAFLREVPKGANVFLSAGCSGGWFFDWVQQCYGDIPRHIGLEYYTPRPDALPANVEWIENTCSDMSGVADQSCDLVFSGQNLEHLWTDEAIGFFLEAARVTRPGGLLVIDSPNRSITEALRDWSHPEHTVELTTAEAVAATEMAGFDVVAVKGIWLCRDPDTGLVLPFQHNNEGTVSLEERLIGGVAQPERAFLWWIEARRASRAPDQAALRDYLTAIFQKAWPERITRSSVGVGRVETDAEGEWVICPPGTTGPLIYGPYMPLRAGRYRCTFDMQGGDPATRVLCDVVWGERGDAMNSEELVIGPERKTVELAFTVPALQFGFQFRCFNLGGGGLRCLRVARLEELSLDIGS